MQKISLGSGSSHTYGIFIQFFEKNRTPCRETDPVGGPNNGFYFCYTWRAIFRPFFVILVIFSKILLYSHLVILPPFLIFLLYLFGYTWPLVKIFVIPGFVIPLNKYNKKTLIKDGLLTFLRCNVYLYSFFLLYLF